MFFGYDQRVFLVSFINKVMKKFLFSPVVRVILAVLLALPKPGFASAIDNGLVAHLSFDGGLADDSGQGNNGKAVGAPGFTAGKTGSALSYTSLSGGNSFNYVTLASSPGLLFGATTNFTVAFWVNFTNSAEDIPFIANMDWSSGDNVGWAIAMQNNGGWQWNLSGGDPTSSPAYYQDSSYLRDGNWHHLAVTFNRQASASAYVDGVLVNQTPISASTGTIDAGFPVNIGQDGTGTYTDGGLAHVVNAHLDDLGIWTRELSPVEIGLIYVQGSSGVNITHIPDTTNPFLYQISPFAGATNASPGGAFSAGIQDGSANTINSSSIQLALDGALVAPTVQSANGVTTVQYAPPALLAPLSSHRYSLVYSDNNTPPDTFSNSIPFVVAGYTNILLTNLIYLETFDEIQPGSTLPTGWSAQNFSEADPSDASQSIYDPLDAAYMNWVVISRQIVGNLEAAGIWEANNRLQVAPLQVVNGILLTNLVETNFVYAESDTRVGAAVQYLFSPDYNLTGQTNVFISYHCIYEQSDNNIGAVEYSTNQGAGWLPIVYMLDGTPQDNQIAYLTNGAGTLIDAVATMTNFNPAIPTYPDPITGLPVGGYYGAFIAAPISQALAPYISPRINGDPVGSKKIEVFRIPSADGQAAVRFRFAQAGYTSWYFGIDDFGIYRGAAPVQSTPVKFTAASVAPGSISLNWAGGTPPYTIESNSQLGTTNWVNVLTTSATTAVIPSSGARNFYRIASPASN